MRAKRADGGRTAGSFACRTFVASSRTSSGTPIGWRSRSRQDGAGGDSKQIKVFCAEGCGRLPSFAALMLITNPAGCGSLA